MTNTLGECVRRGISTAVSLRMVGSVVEAWLGLETMPWDWPRLAEARGKSQAKAQGPKLRESHWARPALSHGLDQTIQVN
jgi:hypothetical protein